MSFFSHFNPPVTLRKVFSYLWGLWKFSEHSDYVLIKLCLHEYICMKNLTEIYYLILKLSVISSAFVQSKWILKNLVRAAVGEKSSFLISHPNLPSRFYEMNAETKSSLITLSQKHNRKKSSLSALGFLICNWNGREWSGSKVCQQGRQTHCTENKRSDTKLFLPNWNAGNCQPVPIHTEWM